MLGGDRVTQVRAVIQSSGGQREDPGFWEATGRPRVLGGDGKTQGSGGRRDDPGFWGAMG